MTSFSRNIFLFLFFLSLTLGAFSQVDELDEMVDNTDSIQTHTYFEFTSSDCPKLDSIIQYALNQRGKQYQYASFGPNTFDCSGLMYHTFNQFNINLGRSSRDQYKEGVKVNVKDIKPGDLVFFYRGKKSKKYIGHVGLVVDVDSNKNFTFVHSSSPKYGVRLDYSTRSGYASTFVGARRIIDCGNYTPNLFEITKETTTNQKHNLDKHTADPINNISSTVVNQTAKRKEYVVKKGDTLSAISRKYKVSVYDIQKWNKLKTDKIYPGQKLKIAFTN